MGREKKGGHDARTYREAARAAGAEKDQDELPDLRCQTDCPRLIKKSSPRARERERLRDHQYLTPDRLIRSPEGNIAGLKEQRVRRFRAHDSRSPRHQL